MKSIRPSKKLGQNFLTNKGIVKKTVQAANLVPDDIVLEVGPGLGALTKEIAQKAKKVIAVEKDKKLIPLLKEELKDYKNIKIINADILKIRRGPSSTDFANYKVIASLPFYAASPIIRMFLENPPASRQPQKMVLIVQKEVAQKIVAKPPKMNILAVSVQVYGKPEIVSYISKGSFWPAPKVDSAILKITPFKKPIEVGPLYFFRIVRAGFAHPRKQLINNFSKELKIKKEDVELWLKKNSIDPTRRAQTLFVQDWINLAKSQ